MYIYAFIFFIFIFDTVLSPLSRASEWTAPTVCDCFIGPKREPLKYCSVIDILNTTSGFELTCMHQ